jgi:hypothetical protein
MSALLLKEAEVHISWSYVCLGLCYSQYFLQFFKLSPESKKKWNRDLGGVSDVAWLLAKDKISINSRRGFERTGRTHISMQDTQQKTIERRGSQHSHRGCVVYVATSLGGKTHGQTAR